MAKKTSARTNMDEVRLQWRKKYPIVLAVYILVFGLLTGLLKRTSPDPNFTINIMLIAGFTSYVFLYIFYIYGVRPIELEHHFKKK